MRRSREFVNIVTCSMCGILVVCYLGRGEIFNYEALLLCSIAQTESLEDHAAKTGLLLEYINRGMSLGCFYYARCLQTGKGVQKNEEEAKKYFKKVF